MDNLFRQHYRSGELHSRRAMLQAMLDGTQSLVVLLDTRGLVVDANRVAFASIVASIEQVADVPFENTEWCNHDTGQVERLRDAINRAADGATVRIDLAQRTISGDLRTMDFVITPCRDQAGAIVWLVSEGHDVTDLRRLEVERSALEQCMHHSERLVSVGRLAGGVAHDFNNLLTVMANGLDLLRDEESNDRPNGEILDDMSKAVHGATALARQLLAFSRKQASVSEDFVVDEKAQTVAKMWRRVLSDSIILNVELNAPDSNVRMPKGHYEQILVNLIVNAQDAMPKGGTLTLRTEYKSFHALPPQAIGQRHIKGPHVVTTLTDTGCGMSPDTLQQAFGLFFTTKARGTGFGLATVYGLVTQAGGFVTLESTQGKGTRVGIGLPLVEADQRDTPVPESGTRRSSAVLLVGDDVSNLASDQPLWAKFR